MKGTIELPGDKSISHRVAMLAAIANQKCQIQNYNRGTDCLSTLNCLQRLGVSVEGDLIIEPAPLQEPDEPLNCGNSGSTIRMLTGLLAGKNVSATLIGDVSLLRRPMRRLADPLRKMGAVIDLRDEEFAPILLRDGVKQPIQYTMPIASAQVKSAILFAGLALSGMRVREPYPTRDHTERLLEYLELHKKPLVVPSFEYIVPGDPSSAAFFVAGALLNEGSEITIRNVLINPHRTAYLRKLYQSGAPIEVKNRRLLQNELIGDISVRSATGLTPILIEPEEVPSLIDEIPVLSLLGTMGGFQVSGAIDLRYKESDRIEAMVSNLQSMGIEAEEKEDGYRVFPGPLRPSIATSYGDHRIAMTFAVAGMEVDDSECVKISFPEFFPILNSLI